MRVALCLLLLVLGLQQANAAKLDDAAERYRPYMIEGIGSALAGARDLRDIVNGQRGVIERRTTTAWSAFARAIAPAALAPAALLSLWRFGVGHHLREGARAQREADIDSGGGEDGERDRHPEAHKMMEIEGKQRPLAPTERAQKRAARPPQPNAGER